MEPILLTTVLSCQQVVGILARLQSITLLSPQQRAEISMELRKSVPSCPVIVQPNDSKRTLSNGK